MAEKNTKLSFVIDSSFFLAYILPDEYIEKVQQIFDELKVKKIYFYAPYLLPFEVLNGLQAAVQSKRIDSSLGEELSKKFLKIFVEFVELDFQEVFVLASEYNLTIYDASYLYLSRMKKFPLLTLDNNLAKMA